MNEILAVPRKFVYTGVCQQEYVLQFSHLCLSLAYSFQGDILTPYE
jgi:hypothetical protein